MIKGRKGSNFQFILRISIAAVLGGFLFDCGEMELSFCHARCSPSVPTDQVWESIVELGYQFALGDNITIQPNLQVVFNPSGTGSVPDALVLGMQMSLLF